MKKFIDVVDGVFDEFEAGKKYDTVVINYPKLRHIFEQKESQYSQLNSLFVNSANLFRLLYLSTTSDANLWLITDDETMPYYRHGEANDNENFIEEIGIDNDKKIKTIAATRMVADALGLRFIPNTRIIRFDDLRYRYDWTDFGEDEKVITVHYEPKSKVLFIDENTKGIHVLVNGNKISDLTIVGWIDASKHSGSVTEFRDFSTLAESFRTIIVGERIGLNWRINSAAQNNGWKLIEEFSISALTRKTVIGSRTTKSMTLFSKTNNPTLNAKPEIDTTHLVATLDDVVKGAVNKSAKNNSEILFVFFADVKAKNACSDLQDGVKYTSINL